MHYLELLSLGLIKHSRFLEALVVLTKIQTLFGDNEATLCNIAIVHLNIGNMAESEKCFKLIVDSNATTNADVCLNMLEFSIIYDKFNTEELLNKY